MSPLYAWRMARAMARLVRHRGKGGGELLDFASAGIGNRVSRAGGEGIGGLQLAPAAGVRGAYGCRWCGR
jgi:hypothetical protein